ncbi:MAG TPA: hypothetical protein VEX60_08445 [Pyrinomonadaceae bacterium]|nr:hypothetical protein [Pyrinomonadaceae bacterium]
MAQNGKLKLELVDVYGKRLQEKVDISLRNLRVTHNLVFKNLDASKLIQITQLFTRTDGTYQLTIDPPSYHVVSRFVNIKTSGTTDLQIPFPIDAGKVTSVNFPSFASLSKEARGVLTNSPAVSGFEHKTGADLLDALDSIRRAGLLNIACKALATIFPDGANVLSLIKELRIVRGDRFFAFVDPALRDETINSISDGLFHEVNGSLHKLPPEFVGFEDADSFKTDDHFGNLQITFFRRGDEMVADIDLDDAAGIQHVFQVLRNRFTGSPTHPYNIHEILVRHQKLDPKYTFSIK